MKSLSPALSSTVPPAFDTWRMWDYWKPYLFNFNGAPSPLYEEVSYLEDAYVAISRVDHLILYLVAEDNAPVDRKACTEIDDPVLILALSTTNSAHSLSELISFLNFYVDNKLDVKVGVGAVVQEKLPYLFQIIQQFIPTDKLVILESDQRYFMKSAWIRRNLHFNYIKTWMNIPYEEQGDELTFRDLQSTSEDYLDTPELLQKLAADIYTANKHKYPHYDRVMLAKTRDDKAMTTPGRAMELTPEGRAKLEAAGIKILSVANFSGIEEYLTVLYGARVFVTSYGGAACTNRFFLAPDAKVLLIGNLHYKWEYDYPSDMGAQWHIRHSHLFPVAEQKILLNHSDTLSEDNAGRIIDLVNQLSPETAS